MNLSLVSSSGQPTNLLKPRSKFSNVSGGVIEGFLEIILDILKQYTDATILKGSTCIEFTGDNWYRFNLNNVENCKKKSKGLKSYKDLNFNYVENMQGLI